MIRSTLYLGAEASASTGPRLVYVLKGPCHLDSPTREPEEKCGP